MNTSVTQNPPSPAAPPVDSAAGQFRSLILSSGVYGLSDRVKLALTGKDRVRWLNGMISNNVRDLAAGQGVYGFLLTPQGKILGDLFAYNRGESILVDTDQAQLAKVQETLKRYIIMDKVEIAEVSDKFGGLGLAGPKSAELLRTAGLKVGELGGLQLVDITWQGIALTVVGGDNPAVPSYEFWIAPQNMPTLQAALLEAGAKPVGAEALELLRIASGVPRYRQDIRDRDLPQETGQARALNFNKGCYIGQEIVERIRARGNVHRMFTGFLVAGELPDAGTKIQSQDKDVGEVTSIATLPLQSGESKVALGYLRREAAAKELTAGPAILSVTDLPFRQVFG